MNIKKVFFHRASQVMLEVKNPSANAADMRYRFDPWVQEDPLEEEIAVLVLYYI